MITVYNEDSTTCLEIDEEQYEYIQDCVDEYNQMLDNDFHLLSIGMKQVPTNVIDLEDGTELHLELDDRILN